MANSTSITYRLKRKILTFTNKISRTASAPDRKFIAHIVYGILASKSCLLTDIVDQLTSSMSLPKRFIPWTGFPGISKKEPQPLFPFLISRL